MRRPLAVLRRAVAGSLDFALGTAPSASTPTAAPAPPARGRFVVGAVSFSRRLEAAVPLAADRLLGLATLAGLPAGIPVRIVEGVEVFTRSRPGYGSLLVIEAARQRPIASLFAATAAAPATPAAPAAPAASFVDIIARTRAGLTLARDDRGATTIRPGSVRPGGPLFVIHRGPSGRLLPWRCFGLDARTRRRSFARGSPRAERKLVGITGGRARGRFDGRPLHPRFCRRCRGLPGRWSGRASLGRFQTERSGQITPV
jgi:hypothetical protein